MAVWAANLTTVRLSSGISANILDFGIPQKHVVCDLLAMETVRKAGVGEVQAYQQRQGLNGQGARCGFRADPGESPWEFRSTGSMTSSGPNRASRPGRRQKSPPFRQWQAREL